MQQIIDAINAKLATQPRVLVAIDGMAAAGKSTLAAQLAQHFSANLYHMDDFFLQPQQRTPQRLAEPGGNVDRERFKAEVLTPLCTGQPVAYRLYNCGTRQLEDTVHTTPRAVEIIEGAYALHPYFGDVYDVTAFYGIDAETQMQRITARNGEAMAQRFRTEWIPMELAYINAFHIREKAQIIL